MPLTRSSPLASDRSDRRRHIVEISPRGVEELCLAYTRLRLVEDELLSALSAEEKATLYHLLVRAVGVKSPPCDEPEQGDEPEQATNQSRMKEHRND